MSSVLKKCSCESKFQDECYGNGIRLFNVGINKMSCTVCGREIKEDTSKLTKTTDK